MVLTASLATCAPNNDIQLIITLIKYDYPDISKGIVKKKMMAHFWYLSDELVGLRLIKMSQ